jgi:hypothetical protein
MLFRSIGGKLGNWNPVASSGGVQYPCGRDFPVGDKGDISVGFGCIDSDNILAL